MLFDKVTRDIYVVRYDINALRQFLDAQRIHNLVTYLQELHSLGLANAVTQLSP